MLLIAMGVLLGVVTAVFALVALYLVALFCWESITCWLAAPRSGVEAADLGGLD